MSTPRPELRVGDRERDAVAETLREAVAEGRLGLDELDARLDAALAARTYADLDPLVADLPVPLPSETAAEPPASPPKRQGPGWSAEDPLVLDPGWSSLTRTGEWDVPPFLRLHGAHGALRLDFLEATALAPTIDVEATGGSGSITVVLPDGWAANRDRLTNRWGTAWFRVGSRPAAGRPELVFRGTTGLSALVVRHAGWFERRRLARRLATVPRRRLDR